MQACVIPAVTPIFQAYDADRFAEVTCVTCHPGAAEYDFAMPGLFPLNWDYAGNWVEAGIYVGDGTGFMEQLTTEMVTTLGEEPYNMETGEGFGCYGCHAM
jgi:hypothetical protein